MTTLPKGYRQFQEKYPQVYAAYETLGKTAAESGPLDEKTRELITGQFLSDLLHS